MNKLITLIILLTLATCSFAQTNGQDLYDMTIRGTATFDGYRVAVDDREVAAVWMINAAVQGSTYKEAVDVATTDNIDLFGLDTIDNYPPPMDSIRVLVKNQTDKSENGVYLLLADAWVRTTDFNTWEELYRSSVFVVNGTENTGSTWTSVMAETGTLDSDINEWTKTGQIVFPDFAKYKIDSLAVRDGELFVYQKGYPDSVQVYTEGILTSSGLTGFVIGGTGKALNGNITIDYASGYALPTIAQTNQGVTAYNDKVNSLAVTGTTNKTITLTQQDGGTVAGTFTDNDNQVLGYTDGVISITGSATTIPMVTNATHTGEVTGSTTLTITTDAVTNDKLANVSQNTIKGRVSLGTGNPEDLTSIQVKSMLELENVDNTRDINKPVSTAQQTAINNIISQTITNGVVNKAPSEDAVYDALQDIINGELDLSSKEDKSNKVTVLSSPTHIQYPSAKLVDSLLNLKAPLISPSLVTPNIGVASGTSLNKVTITTPSNGATLTIADGKTLTVSNNANVSGTNTGDQDLSSSINTILLSGDATGVDISTLPVVVANTAKVTNATHSGDVSGATILTISSDAVTNSKLNNMAQNTIKGRISNGSGDPEDLTANQVKTILSLNNVDNTSDVSKPVSTAQSIAINAKVAQTITNGVTTSAPSQDAVYDALAAKADTGDFPSLELTQLGNNIFLTGDATPVDISQVTAVQLNTAKVTNATHSGDVSGATILTIGDDKILEKHLKSLNAPAQGYALTYDGTSGGDFRWVNVSTTAYTDAKIEDQISNGITDKAPSQNATYDALTLKQNLSDKVTVLYNPSDVQYPSALLLSTELNKKANNISPVLVTPTLGVASATSINKVTITAPATNATLTIANGKTLTVSNDATVSDVNTGDQVLTYDAINHKVNLSGGTAAIIPRFSSSNNNWGLVPGSNNNTNRYLRGDGTWQPISVISGSVTSFLSLTDTPDSYSGGSFGKGLITGTNGVLFSEIYGSDDMFWVREKYTSSEGSTTDYHTEVDGACYNSGNPTQTSFDIQYSLPMMTGIGEYVVGFNITSAVQVESISIDIDGVFAYSAEFVGFCSFAYLPATTKSYTIDVTVVLANPLEVAQCFNGIASVTGIIPGSSSSNVSGIKFLDENRNPTKYILGHNGNYSFSNQSKESIGTGNLYWGAVTPQTTETNTLRIGGIASGNLDTNEITFTGKAKSTSLQVGTGSTITRTGTNASFDHWLGTQAEYDADTPKNGILPKAATTIADIILE